METDLLSQIRYGGIMYILLVIAITMHEYGHALAADKLGDPLPRLHGRVSINPLVHMDMLGTVILPLITIAMSVGMSFPMVFGWGKPVITQAPSGKNAMKVDLLSTAGGVAMNLVVAFISAVLLGILAIFGLKDFVEIAMYSIMINCVLFVINMIPVPPLDGSRFLKYAVNMSDELYMRISQWGIVILIVLINIPLAMNIIHAIVSALTGGFLIVSNIIFQLSQ